MKPFLILFLVTFSLVSLAQNRPKQPVAIILDTDIGPDYDDVGAMAVLHALADRGEARPLAVIASNKHELVVPTIDVLNTYFGRPNLPTGVTKGPGVVDGAWQKWPEMLVAAYPHTRRSSNDAPDAVTTYRQILASEPDASVTIVTVGFLSNMANLLDSKPDRYSRMGGKELVKQKVKELVSMAGAFPKGREFNVYKDSVASEKAFANWPTPVIFSGFEIGKQIKTGPRLVANSTLKSPVKDVFAFCMPKTKQDADGRMSWDQTAVLVAIRGVEPYYGLKRGRFVINGGTNSWEDDPNGPHYYLVEKMPVAQVTEVIETLMMHQPVKK
ncbi:nucleoside hydrolase [Larkinella knui]|uniref:Nucleoside hydrolase n=1 Tax=Larkinella knui TaxID=2025310 RepID=A0A3P1CDC8_9BACT|nr:nucleoside hydrolase [Larkinella knui]RRB11309.1 nucleoside hydrolase [Larkinella knui]